MNVFRSVLCGAVLLLPVAGQAWPFFGGDKKESETAPATNATRRYHLLIPDKASEKELLQLFEAKRIVMMQLQTLALLSEEKRREMKKFDDELSKAFSISDKSAYRYDAKTRTLYEQMPRPDGTGTNAAAEGGMAEKVHLQFKDEEQAGKFAGLAAAKRVTLDELQVFHRVSREKQVEMDRLDKTLKEKFSVSRDRNYWYDAKTMRLYEVVDAPRRGALQGQSSL